MAAKRNRVKAVGYVRTSSATNVGASAQELGVVALIKLGMRVLTVAGDDLTTTDDPMNVAMRQIAGAFSQLEKARLVAKLKAAREQKKAKYGKCEGRNCRPKACPMARLALLSRPKATRRAAVSRMWRQPFRKCWGREP